MSHTSTPSIALGRCSRCGYMLCKSISFESHDDSASPAVALAWSWKKARLLKVTLVRNDRMYFNYVIDLCCLCCYFLFYVVIFDFDFLFSLQFSSFHYIQIHYSNSK